MSGRVWERADPLQQLGSKCRLEGHFRLDLRKKFFTMRVVKPWPRLLREVVDAPPLEIFKIWLDGL